MAHTHKSSAATWKDLTFAEQVRAALPQAREILLEHGIMADPTPGQQLITERLTTLTGDSYLRSARDLDENQFARLCDSLEAAQVLGIALGLLLRPDAFLEQAGAR